MYDDFRKIIIRRIVYGNQTNPADEPLNSSPANRWMFYLTLIPVVAVVVVLGAFFFSIVLALFAVVAAGVGARLWWLRRKFRKEMSAAAEQNNAMIEDAEIIEIREDDKNDRKHR
ncbi:hypothetical protein FBR06_08345 [Betaproteobacteria bacterium PRO4]|uniref:hypothetical protein n=1 Tax=Nitrosomonas sp. TaxID=42353 RepID=UPI00256A1AA8|nr:hypothetical protein [Nitrosomonas sp.]MDL1867231.1 hypothetical protein [Betaproteobacteria bacterium PRO4]